MNNKALINCRICDTPVEPSYIFKEMMFGTRKQFPYGECPHCGSIQIMDVPADIQKHYPPYYMAFNQPVPPLKRQPFLKRLVSRMRMKRKYSKPNTGPLDLLRPFNTMPGAKILDIGCGKGRLICELFNLGFEDVTGVDKFIGNEIDYGFGVKVLKKDLSELPSNTYDVLIAHHVLEHVDEQVKEMEQCHRLLKSGGVFLICVPVLGEAWDTYKENWVQLDAPRHFVLHTINSMGILAERTGFKVSKTIFDSTAFQFLGSELYKRDIPLTLPDTHEDYPVEQLFTPDELTTFWERSAALNVAHRGDSARFYLYKKQ
ncbi:class I SAM-dependent methyltransferase [Mucilaginibacter sp. ZT4R22]|uniref:Class I SAM-dependent methyltransferase n=1 Tax=Mucilaginibacter pankratovii TaxID=2772110 RepID=A0ABR7WPB4_9SPHI|nr:class I SAM-dependent methyltransferase [Mucilaginibacter pankratovii]MBD1363322.1 class I SAM-dependent methyltransferase [Mucilaginibacter pankratovii]